MERRSTADYFAHHGGDVIAGVESSHATLIRGGSTGGVVEAFGDDTNVSLTVRAKNTGLLTLGNSSNRVDLVGSSINIGGASSIVIAPTSTAGVTIGNSSNPIVIGGSSLNLNSTHVNITSTRVQIGGGSTTPISGIQRYTIQFTPPEVSSNAMISSTFTVSGLTTAAAVLFTHNAVLDHQYVVVPRNSTVDELRLTFVNVGGSSIGTGLSTSRGQLLEFRF